MEQNKRHEYNRKLNRKEVLVLESYKTFFPNLEKACEMAKFDIDEFLALTDNNRAFKSRAERIRLNFFSMAENTLVSIINSKDSTDNNKIMASKAILQYKKEISSF